MYISFNMKFELVNFFFFITSNSRNALPLTIFDSKIIKVSPLLSGVFISAFFAALALSHRNYTYIKRDYLLLAVYTMIATAVNQYLTNYKGLSISPLISYVTALFAGTAILLLIACPTIKHFSNIKNNQQPAGFGTIFFIPILLSPFIAFTKNPAVGLSFLYLSTLGFWSILFFINAGFYTLSKLPKRTTFLLAGITIIPEHLLLWFIFCIKASA